VHVLGALEWPLVGRDGELDLVRRVVRDSGSVVVAGASGVGKSRLIAEALGGLGGGVRTVMVRGTRSTATVPFGPFAVWAPTGSGPPVGDRLHVLRAVSRALVNDERQVVVAVDDAHLLDEGSAALVLYLATSTPASVVTTIRRGEQSPDAVVALWKEGLAERVDLRPLGEREVAELAERVLGGAISPGTLRRLWALTAGTPLYLRELVRACLDQGVLVRSGGAWRWRGTLTGSGRLSELMGDRLANLDAEQRRLLELVVIGEPLPVALVRGLDGEAALTDLAGRGLVVTETSGGTEVVRLADRLHGEVLRAETPASTARGRQRALAAAAVAVGWQERDPLRVASWWLESGAVPESGAVYLAAARRALALAEWVLADRLGQAAEAAGEGAEATLVRVAARVQLRGWGAAADLLDGLSPGALHGDLLAQYARFRSGFLFWSRGEFAAGRGVLVDVATRLPDATRSRVRTEAAYLAAFACRPAEAIGLATEAIDDAGPHTALRVQALAVAALAWILQGRMSAAIRAAEAASASVAALLAADPAPGNPARLMTTTHCLALALAGRLSEAATRAAAVWEAVENEDTEVLRATTMSVAARIALLEGRIGLARQRGHDAVVYAKAPGKQWPAAVLVTAAVQLGDVSTADEVVRQVGSTGPVIPLYERELALARAWLAAARGDVSSAQLMARQAAADAAAEGLWLLEMLALLDVVRLGAPESAETRLVELSEVVDGTLSVAASAYARGAAARDAEGLDRTADRFEAMGATLLAAECAALAAGIHRQRGRRAAHLMSLARARELAARTGARTPALYGIDEPTMLDTLTSREREVAALAARGLTNREIAGRLFLSVRTVHSHLRHTYTKLGINDRAKLVGMFPALSGERAPREPA
jgi:DNA-binding CsgD family transcriptional regulator